MADIATIRITEELRPAICRVFERPEKSESVRCLVHVAKTGPHGCFCCEDEYGFMHEVDAERIQFLDSEGKFGEYAWEEE